MWITTLWPAAASQFANEMDRLFAALLLIAALATVSLFAMTIYFITKYHKSRDVDRSAPHERSWHFEIGWITATLVIFVGLAVWGADLFVRQYEPPRNAQEIYVVAKQWMWKIQHPDGTREINTMHVPSGRPIRLIMASQDVIHSFYVPAFRVKQDVVPGRYESLWFSATQPGRYRLMCAEYCGTQHSTMGGWVVVQEPADYARWLEDQHQQRSLAKQGKALFASLGCGGCHGAGSTVHAPPLDGLYGRPVPLEDGRLVKADERYLRDSIMLPKSEVAAGYAPVMPSYAGQIGEDDLVKLIAFLKAAPAVGDDRQ